MSFGFGFGFTKITAAIRAAFSPSSLFAAGEPGVWLDPSDFSTMFQDAAGTVPVTAVEQPVGCILDKSKGLVLGPELVTNGDFSSGLTGWSAYNAVISVTNGVLKVDDSGNLGVNSSAVQQLPGLVTGKTYVLEFDVVSISGTWSIGFATNATAGSILFPAAVTAKNATGRQRYQFVYDGTRNYLCMEVDGSGVVQYDNISVRELPGNHAFQTTTTSRPVLRQDGNGTHYLYFDGVDDWLVTPTITPGTDKAQVFTGVRKLSDAAHGTVVELGLDTSNTSIGAFCILSPASTVTTGAQDFQSRGTFVSVARGVRLAPNTNILTGLGDISGDRATLRINGVQATQNTADQGTGNYLAYPLYIGRRGGTTFPFNGHLYSLIVRFGSNLPIETIENTEKYINTKTRAF